MKVQIESLKDIQCDCGHKLDSDMYKKVFDGVSSLDAKGCAMEVVNGLIGGELSLSERMFLIDMIIMQVIAMNAMQAANIDHVMQNMPTKGRTDN